MGTSKENNLEMLIKEIEGMDEKKFVAQLREVADAVMEEKIDKLEEYHPYIVVTAGMVLGMVHADNYGVNDFKTGILLLKDKCEISLPQALGMIDDIITKGTKAELIKSIANEYKGNMDVMLGTSIIYGVMMKTLDFAPTVEEGKDEEVEEAEEAPQPKEENDK